MRMNPRRAAKHFARATLIAALVPAIALLYSLPAHAGVTYKLKRKISGLDEPVHMVPDQDSNTRYFIVLKGGEIEIVDDWKLKATPFLDISDRISTGSERGLLSMAFDPDYLDNRRFYVYYTDVNGDITISRFLRKADDKNHADPNSETIMSTVNHPTYSNHNGGMMAFDPIAAENGSSMLYFATGDGGGWGDPNDNAQNLSVGLGKMFRIDVNDPTFDRTRVAYGLRNPWRWSFDSLNGDLRIGDVGQDHWEELDFIDNGEPTGINFGWRKYEGNHLFHDEVIDDSQLRYPFEEYEHINGNCSIVGGYMYRGSIDELYGYYLYADYCSDNIWKRKPGKNPSKMNSISGDVNNIVSFAEGNLGGLFVISIDGGIYRLQKA
jgi:glucose/arabinose dehydrogenase